MDTKEVEKKAEVELFSFLPKETTDKKRIAEILAPIFTSNATSTLSGVRLIDEDKKMFTPLGKEVANILAVKATEFPFLRVFHCYKYRHEKREFKETTLQLDEPGFYPSPDADSSRDKYKDVWNDESFFALLENKHGEVAATCKIVACPDCNGSGKESYMSEKEEDIWMTCPRCDGSGKEGVYICKRCDGKGRVRGTRTIKQRHETNCHWCKGKGKVKSILKAVLQTEAGWASSVKWHKSEAELEKLKIQVRTGKDEERKWYKILEHEPKLHSQDDLYFDWSLLKDDASKKAARLNKIRVIKAKGGVIDPSKHNLSKLPLSDKNDLKRVYDVCYPQKDELRSSYKTYASAFFKQNDKSDPNVRALCCDEEITITTGVGWVRIELYDGGHFWVNTLSKKTNMEIVKSYNDSGNVRITPLYRVDIDSKYRVSDYSVNVQNAIKDAKKKGVPKSSSRGGVNSASTKKRWKFVLLGLLFGFLGFHLAYAKRWFLFLLLWAGFITGGFFYKSNAAEKQSDGAAQQVQQSEQVKSNAEMIGSVGFGIWALLWIGGTLFIKKDGKGNRM